MGVHKDRMKRRGANRREKLRRQARTILQEAGVKADRCYWCGCNLVDYPPNVRPVPDNARTVDHVLSLAYGGTNDLENLVYACSECNSHRSKMSIDEVTRMHETRLRAKPTIGEKLWAEDDCTILDIGHRTLEQAWFNLFGTEYDKTKAISSDDCGDCTVLLMPGDIIVVESYPGNNSIHRKK